MGIVDSFKVFFCCVLLVLVELSWAQKGGAKGAMRNRGKGGGGASRGGGGHHEEADDYGIRKKKELTTLSIFLQEQIYGKNMTTASLEHV